MKFYVASKYENAPAVRAAIAELTALGHEVTHDWTLEVPWDWDDIHEVNKRAPGVSFTDIAAVLSADVFIMLTYNDLPMVGAYVELGAALASWPPPIIYVVGDQLRNTFWYHPNINRVSSLDEIIMEIGRVYS
jgi:hypothetical protein